MTQELSLSCPAVLVEAFTETPCGGNGAAVVLLEKPLAAAAMQALARSLNQSETAFLLRHPGGWHLRWFTPTCEVPLCGHATLAATLALGHWGLMRAGESTSLLSQSGPLAVQLGNLPGTASIVLPSGPLMPAIASAELLGYLDVQLGAVPQAYWESALGYRVVLLPAGAPLQAADLPAQTLPREAWPGLVLMQRIDADPAASEHVPQVLGEACDYQLRFLAPGLGIDEDPVTGSAHALVAPWWLEQLGRQRVHGWQCSDRPGGMVCEAHSSGMIRLSGAGHLLWDGTLQPGCPAFCAWDDLLN
jgi:PhzF family phenazine biosynthesis protein